MIDRPQSPLRYPGSKWTLAPLIAALLPYRRVYLEPFAGSAAVLFHRRASDLEILNDADHKIVNFWRVLRSRPHELAAAVEYTPWSRVEYLDAREDSDDELESARRLVIRCWQGHGSKMVGSSGWCRTKGARRTHALAWLNLPHRIVAVKDRLAAVHLECRDALRLLAEYRIPDAAVYLDPNYHPGTLVEHGRFYRQNLDRAGHLELLALAREHPGPLLLSGYRHPDYDHALSAARGWQRWDLPALADGGRRRTESLWLNPVAVAELPEVGALATQGVTAPELNERIPA